MNKRLSTILLAALLMTGFTVAQEQTAPSPTTAAISNPVTSTTNSCCGTDNKSACTMEKPCTKEMACDKWTMKKSCHDVLTKEERHRFCTTKAAVIAENPTLGTKGHKKELCDAICTKDPSMKPIMEKLKKHCQEMHQKMKLKTSPAGS
ncbi:MAG: hypothetical protein DVB29_01300 [Verrucomicrobia bacterium]|nr:MAG: hypothetical protein DVB29_01300 [Verrucomicrobiota bacterium]